MARCRLSGFTSSSGAGCGMRIQMALGHCCGAPSVREWQCCCYEEARVQSYGPQTDDGVVQALGFAHPEPLYQSRNLGYILYHCNQSLFALYHCMAALPAATVLGRWVSTPQSHHKRYL